MRLLFLGDIVLLNSQHITISDELKCIIKDCDVVCCNLEGPIENSSVPGGTLPISKAGPHCMNSAGVLRCLKELGVNLVTVANNHIMDYGLTGLSHTIDELRRGGLNYVGADLVGDDVYRIQMYSDDGTRIGVVSAADGEVGCSIDGSPGFADGCSSKFRELIRSECNKYDCLIVVAHMGEEEWEIPLPEIRDLYREYIDLGASIVIGQHTHGIQGKELYKNKPIYYSVGDFFNGYRYDRLGYQTDGLGVIIDVDGGTYKTEEIVVGCEDLRIEIKGKEELEYTSSLLKDQGRYMAMVNNACVESYEKYYKLYYALSIGLDLGNQDSIDKFVNHRINHDDIRWDNAMLYHNIAINTHRWCVMRAIRTLQAMENRNDESLL